jgi:hypothetical protein
MSKAVTQPATTELLTLISELIDAHADTVELNAKAGDELWAAHLDYLQALQRAAKTVLARTSGQT